MAIEQGSKETMQDTVDTIAQLATSTASDRGTVATLTTTNAKLATQLEAAQAQIAQLKNKIAALKKDKAFLARTKNHQDNEQQQLLLVAWLPGSKTAYERDMQHEKEQTQGCSKQEQPHGRSPMGQGMMRRGS
jgi:predicted RNase H-like nuclease (RuvC/YqgF family)